MAGRDKHRYKHKLQKREQEAFGHEGRDERGAQWSAGHTQRGVSRARRDRAAGNLRAIPLSRGLAALSVGGVGAAASARLVRGKSAWISGDTLRHAPCGVVWGWK